VFKLATGQVLHIPQTGPAHDRERGHYFVVLTTAKDNDACLLVPVCTAHDRCDRTCVLQPGDHDCVTRESFIMYSNMRLFSAAHIASQIEKNAIELHAATVTQALFSLICAGVEASKFAAPVYKKFYLKPWP
jgi:hypothetical protein